MVSLTVSDLAVSLFRAFINLMSLLETIETHLETHYICKVGELDYSVGRLVTLVLYLWVLLPLAVGRP